MMLWRLDRLSVLERSGYVYDAFSMWLERHLPKSRVHRIVNLKYCWIPAAKC